VPLHVVPSQARLSRVCRFQGKDCTTGIILDHDRFSAGIVDYHSLSPLQSLLEGAVGSRCHPRLASTARILPSVRSVPAGVARNQRQGHRGVRHVDCLNLELEATSSNHIAPGAPATPPPAPPPAPAVRVIEHTRPTYADASTGIATPRQP